MPFEAPVTTAIFHVSELTTYLPRFLDYTIYNMTKNEHESESAD